MQLLNTFIVEDSPVILENLVATLEEVAAVKVVGTTGDESSAVEWMQRSPGACDLMIIDIFLKSGSGIEVLQAASRLGCKPKRVVLTNYATPDIRRRCKELGADRVFDKSSELEDLISYCGRLSEGGDTTPGALG